MRHALAAVVALSVSVVACSGQEKAARVHDAAVYAAVVDSLFPHKNGVVLRDETISLQVERVAGSFRDDVDSLADADRALARSFWDRAAKPARLAPVFEGIRERSSTNVVLGDSATLGRVRTAAEREFESDPQRHVTVTGPYWERFYREFSPSTILISFTSAGYNDDYTRAIVDVRFGCGGLCGGSYTVLLARNGENWRVLRVRDGYVV